MRFSNNISSILHFYIVIITVIIIHHLLKFS